MPIMKNPIKILCSIELVSWLHIWAGKESLKIWWIDSPVVKHPLTNIPYIPWSSIKGRMRGLLEMKKWEYSSKTGKDEKTGEEKTLYLSSEDPTKDCAKYFGCAWDKKISSRLLFSDFALDITQEIVKPYITEKWIMKSNFFEDKAENTIPRFNSGTAKPRHIERIPSWVKFIWYITVIQDDVVDNDTVKNLLEEWISLVEMTFLWWSWSRWYGRVKFTFDTSSLSS